MDIDLLNQFKFTKAINEDASLKKITILGTINQKSALLFLEKLHFESNLINNSNILKDIKLTGNNDVYFWYESNLDKNMFNDVKIQLIYPATQAHIDKYTHQTKIMIKETIQEYKDIILPVINSIPKSHISWVDNILQGKKEQETIIYNDPNPETGFILAPDSKWDQKTLTSLYLLVIVRPHIKSLRDINQSHLPLLNNILEKVGQQVEKKYNNQIPKNQLRMYIHYPPSYYHFHVHITNVENTSAPGMVVGQAHLLNDVIENVSLMNDYYQKKTMHYSLGENHMFKKAFDQSKLLN